MKSKYLILACVVFAFAYLREAQAQQKDSLAESAKREGKVVFYSSEDRTALAEPVKAFQEKYGIPIELNRQSTGRILKVAQSEFETNTVKGDVLDITNPLVFFEWKKKGYLRPWKASNAKDQVSDLFRDGEDIIWSRRLLITCIGYNKKVVKEGDAPKTWQELLTPKWKDKVVTAGPEAGPTFGWIVFMSHKYGWDYFDKLHANNPIVTPSSDQTVALLATGERPVAIVNCFDILEAEAQGSPIANVFPKDGLGVWWAGLAIPKAAPHPNAAMLLANFVMSAEGAAAASRGRHGYVAYLHKDTPMAKVLPPMNDLVKGYPKIDWGNLDAGQVTKEFRKRMGQ
ncbi:MAG TPA: extracellular solute-binding protein [Candidatus Binatia bacterium]|nr:extracellular solute-binding protein [Candidatus Binatia bacterium]